MRKGKTILLFISVIPLLWLAACDSAAPELQQIYWQLNIKNDYEKNMVYESLSLWVHPRDEDGTDDIEFIYLINDDLELMWELSTEDWTQTERQGEVWLGSNFIIMSDLTDFPRGEYRIVLIDSAGERDERTFFMSTPETIKSKEELPDAEISGEAITVKNAENGYSIWGYNDQEVFLGSIKDLHADIPLSQLEESIPGFKTFYLYSYEIDEGFGYITGPYKLQYEDPVRE